MSANKFKQNLRYKKVSERINKKERYDGFNKDEIKAIKITKQYRQIDKELSRFWATALRKDNNNVDWDNMSEEQLDYFEHINKISERLLKTLSKLEEKGIDIDRVINMFNMINCNSVSY